MKFVPECMRAEEPEIEVVREGRTVKSRIKYPKPKRTEQEDLEYDFEDEGYYHNTNGEDI